MFRVLVVDDDPVFACLAEASLARAGYCVRTAADGVEALELLEVEHFDAVLVDLSMPRIDGFRLIGLIRGMPRHNGIVIMVVTVREMSSIELEMDRMGLRAIHTKPVDWSRLARDLESEIHLCSLRK